MIGNSLLRIQNLNSICIRSFSVRKCLASRRPPKEEYENNQFRTRKKTADPFDRRWRWTAKSAEPYNVNGGHVDWTKMTITHRGVQMPGYTDPKTKKFIFVKDMVPEIVVPDLKNCELKPYVAYNVEEIENEVFNSKMLYKRTLETEIIKKYKNSKKVDTQSE